MEIVASRDGGRGVFQAARGPTSLIAEIPRRGVSETRLSPPSRRRAGPCNAKALSPQVYGQGVTKPTADAIFSSGAPEARAVGASHPRRPVKIAYGASRSASLSRLTARAVQIAPDSAATRRSTGRPVTSAATEAASTASTRRGLTLRLSTKTAEGAGRAISVAKRPLTVGGETTAVIEERACHGSIEAVGSRVALATDGENVIKGLRAAIIARCPAGQGVRVDAPPPLSAYCNGRRAVNRGENGTTLAIAMDQNCGRMEANAVAQKAGAQVPAVNKMSIVEGLNISGGVSFDFYDLSVPQL